MDLASSIKDASAKVRDAEVKLDQAETRLANLVELRSQTQRCPFCKLGDISHCLFDTGWCQDCGAVYGIDWDDFQVIWAQPLSEPREHFTCFHQQQAEMLDELWENDAVHARREPYCELCGSKDGHQPEDGRWFCSNCGIVTDRPAR